MRAHPELQLILLFAALGSYTGYCDVSRQFDPVPSPNVSSTGVLLSNYTGM